MNLTAIFGRNGSGKSGYARVLGCAGFTRGDKEVLPNVTKQLDEDFQITAELLLDIDGKEKTISYQVGEPCPEVSSFYVFDSTSVKVHMKGKNTFSFSPAGLSLLTELAEVTDEVRSRLRKKIEEKEISADFEKYFSGESEITLLLENLGPDTDMENFRSLAKLSIEEEKHIHELNMELGKIGLDKIKDDIEKKEKQLAAIQALDTWIKTGQELLNDKAIEEIDHIIARHNELNEKSRELSLESFKHKNFSQTGSDLWHDFITAAQHLAKAEGKSREYPQIGDPCLLCQQPLTEDARQLVMNLWAYLAGEIRTSFENVKEELQRKQRKLKENDNFKLDTDLSMAINLLQDKDTEYKKYVLELIDGYRQRGKKVETALLKRQKIGKLPPLPRHPAKDIEDFENIKMTELAHLRNEDWDEKRKKLEHERNILEHRKKLSELLPEIAKYVEGRIWARQASQIGGSTRHITAKYNQLFKLLVEKRYIEIFQKVIYDLGRPLQVDIDTYGKKGETLKQIVLKTHKSAKEIADPDKVLSEGEKRAVALADFLTEVALDTTSKGIILDDPVTSLDLDWRKTIAKILAKEAVSRQVVVFTHDMPFLYLLLNYAEGKKISKYVHWIKRGDEDDLPGYVWLNNCPALESEYKKPTKAEEYYREAKDELEPKKQERILKDGFGALRSTYEAFIVYEVLNGVVLRFEERISFGRLEAIVWDSELVNEVVKSCERLSRYIEGHLHSDALGSITEVKPKLLREEIDRFIDIRKRWRKQPNRKNKKKKRSYRS